MPSRPRNNPGNMVAMRLAEERVFLGERLKAHVLRPILTAPRSEAFDKGVPVGGV
jgi:hypothetical protein